MGKLTIYTKQDCPLCDEAQMQLKSMFPALTVVKVDIMDSPELATLYRDKVPVFFFEEREIGYWHLPENKLRSLINSG